MSAVYAELLSSIVKFSGDKDLINNKNLTPFVEPGFLWRLENILKELKKNRMLILLKYSDPAAADKKSATKLVNFSKIGEIKIFGVSINRKENEFISKYKYSKINECLRFEKIIESEEEKMKRESLLPNDKKEKLKDGLMDAMKPDNRGFLRSNKEFL